MAMRGHQAGKWRDVAFIPFAAIHPASCGAGANRFSGREPSHKLCMELSGSHNRHRRTCVAMITVAKRAQKTLTRFALRLRYCATFSRATSYRHRTRVGRKTHPAAQALPATSLRHRFTAGYGYAAEHDIHGASICASSPRSIAGLL